MSAPLAAGGRVARRATLFDMDRTLLRKETASLYVRYQRDIGEATLRRVAAQRGFHIERW